MVCLMNAHRPWNPELRARGPLPVRWRSLGLILIAAACAFLPTRDAVAQGDIRTIGKYRAFFHRGGYSEGKRAILTPVALISTSIGGDSVAVPLGDIRALYIRHGTKALHGAAYGAGIGLISTCIGVAAASANSSELEGDIDFGVVMTVGAAMIVSGALIGSIAGSFLAHWERVPLEIQPSIHAESKQVSFMLRLRF